MKRKQYFKLWKVVLCRVVSIATCLTIPASTPPLPILRKTIFLDSLNGPHQNLAQMQSVKIITLGSLRYCDDTLPDNQLGKFKEYLSCVKRSSTFPYDSGKLKNLHLISIMGWQGNVGIMPYMRGQGCR